MLNPINVILNKMLSDPRINSNEVAQNAVNLLRKGDSMGLQQMAENLCKQKGVTAEEVKHAIDLSVYFYETFKNLYGQVCENTKDVETILNYMRSRDLKEVSPSIIYRNYKNLFHHVSCVVNTMEFMQKMLLGRIVKSSHGCKFELY